MFDSQKSRDDAPCVVATPAPKPPIFLTRRCGVCGGDGWIESGFEFGSNVGRGSACSACAGSGSVWVEIKP